MLVRVLGATEVWRDGERLDVGTPKRRALLAALALSGGRAVSVDGLVDLIWGDDPPDGVAGTLQVYVSGLRRVLEPDRAPRTPAAVLVTVTPGYALRLPDGGLDAARFEQAVTGVHRRLAGSRQPWAATGLAGTEVAAAQEALDAALALWRGVPYVELGEAAAATAERARLEELRSVALEDRAVLALAAGDHATVAAETQALTAQHPLRERLWAIHAVALARCGRQADALDALRQVREVLDTELGLEPSQDLRDLQTLVLRQDEALSWSAPAGGVVVAAPQAPAAPGPVVATPPPVELPTLPPWPLVGRDDALDRLLAGLDDAEAGRPRIASVTGEPGIGKSRLVTEVAHRARDRGATVLLGRCSQDDGAPPLWPWQQVLRGLGADLPSVGAEDEGAEFRTFEAVLDQVLGATRDRSVLLVLDDLHWADEPTLRVLTMLASRELGPGGGARLLVLLTWRTHPEPTGALADLVEALARAGQGPRLVLGGLAAAEAATIVEAVAEVAPSGAEAGELAGRTDGNPFFLVEYARLARDRGDLAALVAEVDPPSAVSDVLVRRLGRLPEDTRTQLSWAAVLGREFDLTVLAETSAVDEDDVLDRLDPALAAGLVREDGIGRYAFGHALVRDTVYAGWSATRRARAHARAAAVLDDHPDRVTEAARHWRAAGPAHAARAWRAASVAAAEVVRTRHAHGAAAELLGDALASLAQDPAATPHDRYRLLTERIEAHRWRGEWTALVEDVMAAIAEAERLGDVRLLADAASSTTEGALWQSPAHGTDHPVVLRALRRALEELPSDEQHRRCRVMLALASEGYYVSPAAERDALVDEALALARSLDDERLLLHACLIGFVSTWRPATVERRLRLAGEAAALAARVGDERSRVVADALGAIAHSEVGDPAAMWPRAAASAADAERLHLPYPLMVVDALRVAWHAASDRLEEARGLADSVTALSRQLRMPQAALAEAGVVVAVQIWSGQAAEAAAVVAMLEDEYLPNVAATVALLDRAGLTEEARSFAAEHAVDLDQDNWFSMLNWSLAAEAATLVGDPALAAAAYDRLAPFAGYHASAGSGPGLGPVDAFLALGALTAGDRDLAVRHADDATRLCEEWGVPRVARWWRDQRARHGM